MMYVVPETLRQAKFDQPECRATLWRLLHDLLLLAHGPPPDAWPATPLDLSKAFNATW